VERVCVRTKKKQRRQRRRPRCLGARELGAQLPTRSPEDRRSLTVLVSSKTDEILPTADDAPLPRREFLPSRSHARPPLAVSLSRRVVKISTS